MCIRDRYNTVVLYALPVLGYLAALLTFICGWEYISEAATASHFVAGQVICGVAFITACVATTATSSTRFTLIPVSYTHLIQNLAVCFQNLSPVR